MTLHMQLDRHQQAIRRVLTPGQIVTLAMGRGTGKSHVQAFLIHETAFRYPGIHIGLILPELKQAKKIFWEPFLFGHYYGPLRQHIVGPPNRTELSVRYCNGSRLTTWGAENAAGIRGQRFGAIFQDETDKIDPSVEQAVIKPTFSRAGTSAIYCKAGTPLRGRMGSLYRSWKFAQDGQPGYHAFRVRSDESPWVDQAWLAEVKRTTDPKVFRREYDCDFDAAEGLVYGDVFEESFHVQEPPEGIVFDALIIGQDHGYESPGAAHLIGCFGSGLDASAWVLEEVYERRRTTDWWAAKLKQWVMRHHPARIKLYADPSQPGAIEEYRQKTGVKLPQDKVNNNVDDGIAAVANMLLRRKRSDGTEYARLYVSPGCKNLIREFGLYRYRPDPKEADHYLNDVEKRNDHALDDLRYAVLNHFGPAPSTRRTYGSLEARQ